MLFWITCIISALKLQAISSTSPHDHYSDELDLFACHRCTQPADESQNIAQNNADIPLDCWRLCFQYLSCPTDIGRFRLLSSRHYQLHDDKIQRTCTNFQFIWNNQSLHNKYWDRKQFEGSFYLIPCGQLDLNDDHALKCLMRFHFHSGKVNIRGVVSHSNHSFLSILLQHDVYRSEHALFIWICDADRIVDTRFNRNILSGGSNVYFHGSFKPHSLQRLLKREYIEIGGFNENPIWTMENHYKRWRRRTIKKCRECIESHWDKIDNLLSTNPRQFWIRYFFFGIIFSATSTFCLLAALHRL